MSISNPALADESQIAFEPANQTASKSGMRRVLVIGLAGVISTLACAIVVVAGTRVLSRTEAAVAQAKTETEEARKNAAIRIDALEKENADLKKQFELVKADFVKQAQKLVSAEKEASHIRGDLEAAVKQVAELSKRYSDAVDAEHKARLEEEAAKKEAAAKTAKAPAVVEVVHDVNNNNNANRNGKRRGSVAMLPRTTPSFSELDKNMDGRMSLAEFKAGFPELDNAEEKFKELDTDKDGYLSLDEYKAGFPDPPLVHVQRKKKKS